ncbi:MAG: MBL fold metallo-hydrolase [Gammaproteobacteria bacterium]|nr:MBL fold metallo-hydrolase [Gammaproteobacteria bacterium]
MTIKPTYSIHTLELGPMENFIYVVEDHHTKRAAIVDPAWDVTEILKLTSLHGLNVTDILLSHCHHDHINGVEDVLLKHDAQIHLMKAENEFWHPGFIKPRLLTGGEIIKLGKTDIHVLHTPGHSKGSACFKIGNQLITGDTMFVYGCGHCRLGGSDPEVLFATLQKLKHEIPADTIILPGHNYAPAHPNSSMAEQIKGNPFLHFDNAYDFTKYRTKIHDQIRSDPYDAISADEMAEHCRQYQL